MFIFSTGEYISLYREQRHLLKERQDQKDDYISNLSKDREYMQVRYLRVCYESDSSELTDILDTIQIEYEYNYQLWGFRLNMHYSSDHHYVIT